MVSGGKLQSFGMNLAEKPQTVIGLLMVAAVVGTGYYQQKQMTARLPKDSINPQMQMVTKIFPVFFGVISLSVPAGVVLYFIVSNIWQIGQQAVAFRTRPKLPEEEDAPSDAGSGKSGGGKTGGGAKAALPPTKGGSGPKGGSSSPKGQNPKNTPPKGGGGSTKGGSPKGGGPKAQGGGGSNRPPSGRVTPKGGGRVPPKTSGRVTPKGGPGGAGNSGASSGNKGGKARLGIGGVCFAGRRSR